MRHGPSLLAGLIVCGLCGRRMPVRYGGPNALHSYMCNRLATAPSVLTGARVMVVRLGAGVGEIELDAASQDPGQLTPPSSGESLMSLTLTTTYENGIYRGVSGRFPVWW